MKRALLTLALALSFGTVLFFPTSVQAADCTGVATTTGNFFQDYEQVDYALPDGANSGPKLLHIHFKTNPAYNNAYGLGFDGTATINDECGYNVWSQSPTKRFTLPSGYTNFSVRFASTTHYDLWNDETDTKLDCVGTGDAYSQSGCTGDIQDLPGYYSIRWQSSLTSYGYTIGSFTSSYHPILENPPAPPKFEGNLPVPTGCGPAQFGTNFFFGHNYERSRYVEDPAGSGMKFLQVQYRIDLVNSGNAFKLFPSATDNNCRINYLPNPSYFDVNTRFADPAHYFSIRFTSPTHYDLWNDDTNTRLESSPWCPMCSYDLPNPSPYFLAYLIIGASNDYVIGTPYPVVEPTPPAPPPPGHSNILFIPGLEASRLYQQGALSENQLWEPNRHQDTQDLFLDANGRSIQSGIYTRDVIGEIFDGSNIYKSFITMMNGLTQDGTINSWQAFPYDWRADYGETITAGVNIGNGQIANIITTLESLASTSQTHKVTIVAHSHGGLLAKALVDKLKELGKADLVDKLILVAVPQSGTPETIEALLHGEDQPLFKSFFLPHWLTRGLAEHMPSAYNLLPMPSYYARVIDPVVEFATTTTLTAKWRQMYGNTINNTQELRSFVLGADGRAEPAERDVDTPNVLVPALLDKSDTNAVAQDSWTPPPGLSVTQIVGWGIETIRGIKYTDRTAYTCPEGITGSCPHKVLDRRPLTTTDGDKTVISYSADSLATTTWYVNLKEFNRNQGFLNAQRTHADILEVPDTLDLISDNVTGTSTIIGQYTTILKPIDPDPSMRLSVHSPVSLDVYANDGAHTGLILNPDPTSDLQLVEEQIPNSRYYEFGEGKYVSFPNDGTYRVVIKGTGTGTFTLESESGIGGNYSGGPIFSDIPVTPTSIATLTLDANQPKLFLDIDGNGTTDVIVGEDERMATSTLLSILQYNANQIRPVWQQAKRFNKEIATLLKTMTKEKFKNTFQRLEQLEEIIQHDVRQKKLSVENANPLIKLLEQIKGGI